MLSNKDFEKIFVQKEISFVVFFFMSEIWVYVKSA